MKINLPNQITIARLIISVIFFIFLTLFDASVETPKWYWLNVCAGLFLIAAVTDILDGYLARKHNQVTSFGRIVDPFVDKILVIGAYTFLASDRFVSAEGVKLTHVEDWMVVVIVGRELLVTTLRGVSEGAGQSFGANIYGKLKMWLQSTTIAWALLTLANPEALSWAVPLLPWLVYATVLVTFLSAIPYISQSRGAFAQTAVTANQT